MVLRFVQLTDRGINANLPEQGLHAEGARLIGNDGHHPCTELRLLQQLSQELHKGGGGGLLAPGTALEQLRERRQCRHGQRRGIAASCWQVATQALALGMQVFHLGTVLGRLVKAQGHRVLV